MENIKKKALDYLQSKPNIKVIFSTEDGFLFEKKQDAINHAKSIGDKENPKVETHTSTEAVSRKKSEKQNTEQ